MATTDVSKSFNERKMYASLADVTLLILRLLMLIMTKDNSYILQHGIV